jgi:hypothetical protein
MLPAVWSDEFEEFNPFDASTAEIEALIAAAPDKSDADVAHLQGIVAGLIIAEMRQNMNEPIDGHNLAWQSERLAQVQK